MYYMMMYISFPFAIFSKFVYCKLARRPFIWLPTYTADLLTMGFFCYPLYYHLQWVDVKNPGLWL